jgi:Sulfotransferase family
MRLLNRLFKKDVRRDAMPNLFFVCESRRFLFLSISKNACTTLKHLSYELDTGHPFACGDPWEIHDHLGYAPIPGRVIDRRDRAQLAKLAGYTRFTVYRDPVERLLSAYADKVPPGSVGADFFVKRGLIGMALDPFLDVVEQVLSLQDPLLMDEHLRPQHLCFEPADVEFVVPIEHLTRFLAQRFGVAPTRRFNAGRAKPPEASPRQRARIRELYHRDYQIVPNYEP